MNVCSSSVTPLVSVELTPICASDLSLRVLQLSFLQNLRGLLADMKEGLSDVEASLAATPVS